MKVILKKEMKSAKFNVRFPKGKPLNYSKSLNAVEHPVDKNIWMVVKDNDFKIVEPEYPKTKYLSEHDKTYIQIHAAYGKDFKTIRNGIMCLRKEIQPTLAMENEALDEILDYIRFAIDNQKYIQQSMGFTM